jgi:hypothetical protein
MTLLQQTQYFIPETKNLSNREELAEKLKEIFNWDWNCKIQRLCFTLYLKLRYFKLSNENRKLIRELYPSKSRKSRNCKEERLWRKAVFERDNYTCQECGAKDITLNAHHIISYLKDDSRWLLENGKTLCVYCHRKVNHQKIRKTQ